VLWRCAFALYFQSGLIFIVKIAATSMTFVRNLAVAKENLLEILCMLLKQSPFQMTQTTWITFMMIIFILITITITALLYDS
jgi:hypothetical protein